METPDTARFSNNKSAINNSEFVENSIKEMLPTRTILERGHPLIVVNLLSVSIDSSSKKYLILSLRYINMYLYQNKIKFDDWQCFKNNLLGNKGFLFKFDLKNQTYLGLSCDIKGATKSFVFTGLTFGLSFAPFVFTKVVCPLVKHWRLHAVKIACFLDDGLGITCIYQDPLSCTNFVKTTLLNSGFLLNLTKSAWIPCQRIIWLGIEFGIKNNILSITSSQITSTQ